MRAWWLRTAALVAMAGAVGCSKVERVELTPGTVKLAKAGETATVTATAFDGENGIVENRKFEFSSSDTDVATVDGVGVVTAVRSGKATITATVGEVSGTADVEVRIPAKISFKKNAFVLKGVGAAEDVEVVVVDDVGKPITGAQPNVVVENGAIASVAGRTITAIALGATKVTASYGSVTTTADLSVSLPVFNRLAIDPAGPLVLRAGDMLSLTIAALDESGVGVSGVPMPTFASSNAAVAAIDVRGMIRALAPGNADVTVTAGDKVGIVRVTVRE